MAGESRIKPSDSEDTSESLLRHHCKYIGSGEDKGNFSIRPQHFDAKFNSKAGRRTFVSGEVASFGMGRSEYRFYRIFLGTKIFQMAPDRGHRLTIAP